MLSTLKADRIIPALHATSKKEVLRELAENLLPCCQNKTLDDISSILQDREEIGSTGIGDGIAIPHGKIKGLDKIEICFGRSPSGIPFESADNKPAYLFFLLLAPPDSSGPYLNTLAGLARFLKNPHTRSRLIEAENTEEILEIFHSTA